MNNMAATQRLDKRMGFRNRIRSNQIEDWLKHQREKQMSTSQQLDYEHFENNSISPFKSGARKGHTDTKAMIDAILFAGLDNGSSTTYSKIDNLNCNQPRSIRRIGSQTVRRVWQLALKSQSQPCLSQRSMDALLTNAQIDFNALIVNNGSAQISSRLGETLWILSNECYKNPQISMRQAAKAISLSVRILCIKQDSNHSSKNIDEYIVGLCVILLGNICVSESHVQLILKKVKLKNVVSMLDGLLDPCNQEDLSFVISNILYYYPQKIDLESVQLNEQVIQIEKCSTNVSAESTILLSEKQLELVEVLHLLQIQLYGDLLRHLEHLIISKNTLLSKSTKVRNDKNGHSIDQPSTLLERCALSTQERLELNTAKPFMISENYTNDLLQCVVKVKEIIHTLQLRDKYYIKNNQEQKKVEIAIAKQRTTVCSLQEKLLDVGIRVLLLSQPTDSRTLHKSEVNSHHTPSKQKIKTADDQGILLLKHRNILTFILDVYRMFEIKQPSGVIGQLQTNANRKIEDMIIRKYSILIFDYSHRFLIMDSNTSRADSLLNKERTREQEEMLADIEEALWEVYCMTINSLKNQAKNNEQFEELLDNEISWIENRLVSTKVCLSPTCQSKLISIISDVYPVIIRNQYKKEKRSCNSNKRDSILLRYSHEQATENSTSQSQESTYEYIEIDMAKLSEIMTLLECKIKQHQNCPIMLLAVLRAVSSVVGKVKVCFNGATLDIQSQRDVGNTEVFPIKVVLGQSLYELIYHHLLEKYQSVDQQDIVVEQINSLIAEITSTVEPIKEEDEPLEDLIQNQ